MAGVSAPAIEPVRADDRAAMDGWFGLLQVSHVHDAPELPPPCSVGHAARFSWPGFERRAWVVREGHEVVAVAHLTLPQRENLRSAFADVLVAPAHRRLGLGSPLLHPVATDARTARRTPRLPLAERPPDRPG